MINDITELKNINYTKLKQIKGIGISKATRLLAVIELSKRINSKIDTLIGIKASSSKLVFEYYKEKLMNQKQEHFYCLYLDNKKVIIKDKLLYIGTINRTIIHPREIFKEAYNLSASSIICIHNHPSGNVYPSKEDILITNNLKEVGILMGIPVVDHIIVSDRNYYSFYENNDI